ncbi:MAG: cAMP/cGMP-dependent 3',5'-cyclic-AMP/GMP phosphodiesterase [Spirochaetales bacterium]|nr:cAMP/cGMP-dependent 3',5'-cyclic-AMP/GMP phosphodiesterase [Spirochaetales bacterium]
MGEHYGYQELPRGGYIVATSAGRIQFGAPPETIKDTLVTEEGVPEIFVLPRAMFNWSKGINVADMEFPIYYHFFIRQQRPLVCGTMEQARSLATALQEAVFGPKDFDLQDDLIDIGDDVFVPDIRPELAFFRGELDLKSLFRFRPFQDGRLSAGNVTITEKDGDFEVFDNGGIIARVPGAVQYMPKIDVGRTLPEPFIPPRFGVTCLGPSHGFDPTDNTSGFIIWLNHNGVMVDPPVNSTEWLLKSNVNPKFIDSIILTHCHADHDAGTFQKMLEESRITIYSTKTVMESFLRKYSAFSGESPAYLRKLFSFQPIYIGRPVMIHGGEFDITYALHSIPTIGFRLGFQGKSFVYSSDHQGDPEVQAKMFQDGVIGRDRYDQLRDFPWDSDVIYHESGIPPLHTPLKFLASLPEDVQSRAVVYHIAEKDFNAIGETALQRATFGIENTLYFETEPSRYEDAYRALDLLKRLDFFESLPIKKVQEFLSIIEHRHFKRGDKIIEEGSRGDYFYIIASGNASVMKANLVRQKQLGAFEYFGEVALLTNSTRTADIVADTEIDAIAIPRNRFVNFVSGTEFGRILQRVIDSRDEKIWNLLVESETFVRLTDYQRMWMETCLQPQAIPGNSTIAAQGDVLPGLYIVQDGEVIVAKDGEEVGTVGRGEAIGMLDHILRDASSGFTFSTAEPASLLYLSRDDAADFVERNPGIATRIESRYS